MEEVNLDSLIEIDPIIKILDNNYGKRIFCFGAGTAGEGLIKMLPPQYHIDAFLDNNEKMHGKDFCGIKIFSPEILMTECNYIVLINSRFREAIAAQIQEYGLKENEDYFIIYDSFESWVRMQKFKARTEKLYYFIEQIPDDLLNSVKNNNENHLGIVCMDYAPRAIQWRDIGVFLLLLYNGYNVSLIFDHLESFADYYFPNSGVLTVPFCNKMVQLLQKKFNNLSVYYCDENKQDALEEDDEQEISKLTEINIKYFTAQKYYKAKMKNNEEVREVFKNVLYRNMRILKAFFKENRFDTIQVSGGICENTGIYTWLGKKLGFRVSSYDGTAASSSGGEYETIISTDLPCGYSMDIEKTIKGGFFTEKEKKEIISLAMQSFNVRKRASFNTTGYNFQLVEGSQGTKYDYDILIPLNIDYDAGALGLDDVFSSTEEWLKETILFILEKTDAKIAIREHPVSNFFDERECDKDYYPVIKKIIDLYHERCVYIKADEKINTYDILSNAKVVLPFSSTVGIEAALMNKNVIVHTNCFYGKFDFVKKAETKQEYFNYITNALSEEEQLELRQKEEAYLCYYCQMNNTTPSKLSEANDKWMESSIEELNKEQNTQKLLKVIGEEIPICYSNIIEKLGNEQIN